MTFWIYSNIKLMHPDICYINPLTLQLHRIHSINRPFMIICLINLVNSKIFCFIIPAKQLTVAWLEGHEYALVVHANIIYFSEYSKCFENHYIRTCKAPNVHRQLSTDWYEDRCICQLLNLSDSLSVDWKPGINSFYVPQTHKCKCAFWETEHHHRFFAGAVSIHKIRDVMGSTYSNG